MSVNHYFLADTKRSFWMAYIVNILVVTGFAAQMQFGNYIESLGGSAFLGSVVLSIGVFAGIFYKFYLSQMFARVSLKIIWMLSISMMFIGSLVFAYQSSMDFAVYLSRAVFVCGYGGAIACGILYVLRLTEKRFRTQTISYYSTSHFIGLFLGPIFSDLLLAQYGYEALFFHTLFVSIAVSVAIGLMIVIFMPDMYFDQRDSTKQKLNFNLLKTMNSSAAGLLLVGSFSLGLAFTIPQFYLAMYAKSIGMQSISSFFAAYTITGFCMRMFFSSMHYEKNRSQMLVLGFGCFAASQLLLLVPLPILGFLIPGIIAGVARSVIEPALLTLGSDILPVKNRDFGTTLVLVAIDVGMVCSAPMLGLIAKQSYLWLFVCTAIFFSVICSVLAIRKKHITFASTSEEEKKIDGEWVSSKKTNILVSGKLHAHAVRKLFDNKNILVKYIPYASLFELRLYIPQAHVLVCDHETEVTRKLLSKAPHLRLVSSSSLSLSRIDLDVCEQNNVEVVNLPVRRADIVADMTLGTLVSVFQKNSISAGQQRHGADLDKQILSKRMAIWGRGSLTKELVYQAEKVGIAVAVIKDIAQLKSSNMMKLFDIFVVTEPLTIHSYQRIHLENLSTLKEDVVVVNLSKTDVIKHEDIAKFLQVNTNASYICDILDEPLSNKDKWLLNHPRVFCTPHILGISKESFADIGEAVVSSIEDLYERRDNSRIDISENSDVSLNLYRCVDDSHIKVSVFDLSLRGLGVLSSTDFAQGEKLQLRFNNDSQKIDLVVKRAFRHGTARYRVGLLATDLEINLIESVKNILAMSNVHSDFDRRKSSRDSLTRQAIVQDPNGNFNIEIMDHSEAGLGFKTPKYISPGSFIRLQDGERVYDIEITWRSSLAGSMYAYGSRVCTQEEKSSQQYKKAS